MPPLVVGNWKMHGTQQMALSLARKVKRAARELRGVEIGVAPPFTALPALARVLKDSPVALVAQNVHWQAAGAFTGEISALMLTELGCRYAIVGHSERRHIFKETDEHVARRFSACLTDALRPILCVGETWPERRRGATERVLERQLDSALKGIGKTAIGKFDIAYEPVWAIGTGHNATPEQVSAVHGWIVKSFRRFLGDRGHKRASRILYGGSVRPDNCASLAAVDDVDGFLVGGASLDAESFVAIARAFC
ncbi:MAG TPA: triose-phosphate isomerase [Candidatus Acidoferrales bacterium]|nr:triose-phosphate isomerase [Candidatus Acidoferrales bacterium]